MAHTFKGQGTYILSNWGFYTDETQTLGRNLVFPILISLESHSLNSPSGLPIYTELTFFYTGEFVLGRSFTNYDTEYPSANIDEILIFKQSMSTSEVNNLYSYYG